MASKAELQSLLERVEKAVGPDSELDEAIRFQFDPMGSVFYSEHSAYTASIDNVRALAERLLPGSMMRVFDNPDDGSVRAEIVAESCAHGRGDHDTWSLAILAALLRALIAQADEVEG